MKLNSGTMKFWYHRSEIEKRENKLSDKQDDLSWLITVEYACTNIDEMDIIATKPLEVR